MHRLFPVAALCALLAIPANAADWPLFGHDPARSGVDSSGPVLTVANVRGLHRRWQASFGTNADSTPIYLERVVVAGRARAMLFQTDTAGVTYGIDAANGRVLWRFATRGTNITTSTPAADPSGTAIYVPGVDGYVHKLDAATGRPVAAPGFPARITRMIQTEKDASSLNVANGYLFATTSGYDGDAPPYDGHIVSVRLSDGTTRVFNSLCSQFRVLPTPKMCPDSDSGIWARGGAVVDPDPAMKGAIFAATGNGDFDASADGHNYGDSVVSLTPDLSLLGYYTPADYDQLEYGDVDLGSTSPAMLPRQRNSRTPLLLVQGGKDGYLRLIPRAPLRGVAGEIQKVSLGNQIFATPAVWTDPSGNAWVYVGLPSQIVAFRLETATGGHSRLVHMWTANPGQSSGEGSSVVVSNGIAFGSFDGAVVALNAQSGRLLWSSALASAGGTIGSVHWQSPVVVNGVVYCSDQQGHLTAYGLPVPASTRTLR